MSRQINQAGLDLIKRFEGCKLRAYRDPVGVVTIGYGHTRTARLGQSITNQQAEALLRQDIAEFEDAVESLIDVPLTDNQFAALVSLAFNIGAGALRRSTLRQKLNAGDYSGAAREFLRWDKGGGRVLKGLSRRRYAEMTLFLRADDD
jgi:GH24 family phage-related lysozyme (muramidase)